MQGCVVRRRPSLLGEEPWPACRSVPWRGQMPVVRPHHVHACGPPCPTCTPVLLLPLCGLVLTLRGLFGPVGALLVASFLFVRRAFGSLAGRGAESVPPWAHLPFQAGVLSSLWGTPWTLCDGLWPLWRPVGAGGCGVEPEATPSSCCRRRPPHPPSPIPGGTRLCPGGRGLWARGSGREVASKLLCIRLGGPRAGLG